jgi:hypothetical protein
MFLRRHAELLRALPAWSIRLLVPTAIKRRSSTTDRCFVKELATPLHPTSQRTALVLSKRRRHQVGRRRSPEPCFGAPCFLAIRRAWLHGHRVVDVAMCTSLADAIAVRAAVSNVMSYLVSTFISRPWSARAASPRGGTGRGTGPRARCSPRRARVRFLVNEFDCNRSMFWRGRQVFAPRRVAAAPVGRRFLPPDDYRVPGATVTEAAVA